MPDSPYSGPDRDMIHEINQNVRGIREEMRADRKVVFDKLEDHGLRILSIEGTLMNRDKSEIAEEVAHQAARTERLTKKIAVGGWVFGIAATVINWLHSH